MNRLGRNLKGLRGERTQATVAKALKIPRGTYAHYELGRREPRLDILLQMADLFKVTLDRLCR